MRVARLSFCVLGFVGCADSGGGAGETGTTVGGTLSATVEGDGDGIDDGNDDGDSTGVADDGGTGTTTGPDPGCDPVVVEPEGLFAAPDGSPDGDGSQANPWDLATALDEPAAVAPGDTIWLRGGVYEGSFVSKLDGSDGLPVTVRSYPGEWATIDSGATDEVSLQVYRSYTTIRDLEVTNSNPERVNVGRPSGIYVEGPGHAFINLVVHDVGTGITSNSGTGDEPELALRTLVYGSILFNNGWDADDRSHGHHLYLQNRTEKKTFADNILFNSFGFAIHSYSETDGNHTEGYDIIGNIWFNAGAASSVIDSGEGLSKLYDDVLVGHNGNHAVARLLLSDNIGWARQGERNVRLGWASPQNEDATLTDNYLVGQLIFQDPWQSIAMTDNTVVGPLIGQDPTAFPDTTFLDADPTDNVVFVRPNAHTPHRANIAVFNWEGLDAVAVDLSEVLEPGAAFEVRNAQDYFGPPVEQGVYDGAAVTLSMLDLQVAQPVGLPGALHPDELPHEAFAAFVVIGDSCQ